MSLITIEMRSIRRASINYFDFDLHRETVQSVGKQNRQCWCKVELKENNPRKAVPFTLEQAPRNNLLYENNQMRKHARFKLTLGTTSSLVVIRGF